MKIVLLVALLAAGDPATVIAQRGSLSLAWSNCRVTGGGIQNANFACDTNTGPGQLLVGAFIPNAGSNLNSLNSALLYVDIFQMALGLSNWWQLTDPPVVGCRPLSVWGLDLANTAGAVCDRSYWSEVGPPSGAARWFYPTYEVAHATLRIMVSVDPQAATVANQILPGEESHVFGARLSRVQTVGAGACSGCLTPTHLYFAEADFFQTNGDNFVIDGVGPPNYAMDGPKCATWQVSDPSISCRTEVVPVRNATWGSIKSLYR